MKKSCCLCLLLLLAAGDLGEMENSTVDDGSESVRLESIEPEASQPIFVPDESVIGNSSGSISNKPSFRKAKCLRNSTEVVGEVHVINATSLLAVLADSHNSNVTNKSMSALCMLVFFYAPWCPFSAAAAPHYNALARLFSDITLYAVDSSGHQGINTQFGVLALPTLIGFHNTKPVAKFNLSEYRLENFTHFVETFTDLKASGELALKRADFSAPLPSEVRQETDYCLYGAWLFTVICALVYLGRSSYFERILETAKNNWRQAEIQHEHID